MHTLIARPPVMPAPAPSPAGYRAPAGGWWAVNGRTVADPLYGAIGFSTLEAAILDTPPMQRLSRIRQLNVAQVAYPGATHTRFEHCLGVGSLAKLAGTLLPQRSEKAALPTDEELTEFVLAALVHDIGHSGGIGSHLLEELGYEWADHEHRAHQILSAPPISDLLAAVWPDGSGPERLVRLITGHAHDHPLQPLLSSALDVDKLDYLVRDSRECGVPFGAVDARRLLQHCLLTLDDTGRRVMALHEDALPSLEHLLMGRRLMHQTVYFHKAVRAATAMNQRLGWLLLETGAVAPNDLVNGTDDEFFGLVRRAVLTPQAEALDTEARQDLLQLAQRVLDRQLYRVAASATGDWSSMTIDTNHLMRTVDDVSRVCCGSAGAILLDVPRKVSLFPLDAQIFTERDGLRPLASLTETFPLAAIRSQLEASTSRARLLVRAPLAKRTLEDVLAALGRALPDTAAWSWSLEAGADA